MVAGRSFTFFFPSYSMSLGYLTWFSNVTHLHLTSHTSKNSKTNIARSLKVTQNASIILDLEEKGKKKTRYIFPTTYWRRIFPTTNFSDYLLTKESLISLKGSSNLHHSHFTTEINTFNFNRYVLFLLCLIVTLFVYVLVNWHNIWSD